VYLWYLLQIMDIKYYILFPTCPFFYMSTTSTATCTRRTSH
jgi:hypothetical protein